MRIKLSLRVVTALTLLTSLSGCTTSVTNSPGTDPRSSLELTLLSRAAEKCVSDDDSSVSVRDDGAALDIKPASIAETTAKCLVDELGAPSSTAAVLRGNVSEDHGDLGRWDSNAYLSTSWATDSDGEIVATISLARLQ